MWYLLEELVASTSFHLSIKKNTIQLKNNLHGIIIVHVHIMSVRSHHLSFLYICHIYMSSTHITLWLRTILQTITYVFLNNDVNSWKSYDRRTCLRNYSAALELKFIPTILAESTHAIIELIRFVVKLVAQFTSYLFFELSKIFV